MLCQAFGLFSLTSSLSSKANKHWRGCVFRWYLSVCSFFPQRYQPRCRDWGVELQHNHHRQFWAFPAENQVCPWWTKALTISGPLFLSLCFWPATCLLFQCLTVSSILSLFSSTHPSFTVFDFPILKKSFFLFSLPLLSSVTVFEIWFLIVCVPLNMLLLASSV